MSKHYNKYDRPLVKPETAIDEANPVEEAVVAEELVEEPEVIEEVVVEEPKSEVGVVIDCERLRVRKQSTTNAEVLCTIPKGAAVVITGQVTSSGFYPVCTETGVQGYCMKKYIKVQ